MFRIHFDHRIGLWVIQINWLGMLWLTVKNEKGAISFTKYDDTRDWVKIVGLDKAYHEAHERNAFHSQLAGR